MKRFLFILLTIFFVSCLTSPEENKTRDVKFEVKGTTPEVSVTIGMGDKTEQYANVYTPWTKKVQMQKDEFVYLSAQNEREGGTVRVIIWVDGKIFKEASSSGSYVIATVSGTIP